MKPKSEKQGYYADCYVLTNKRTVDFIFQLLDRFVPNRKVTADEFEVPQYSDLPTNVFSSVDEAIAYLVDNKNTKHSIYWKNLDEGDLKGVELFFTDDGFLICGLYCDTRHPDTMIEDDYFKQLREFCGSDEGYITYENPAVQNSLAFRVEVKKRRHQTI